MQLRVTAVPLATLAAVLALAGCDGPQHESALGSAQAAGTTAAPDGAVAEPRIVVVHKAELTRRAEQISESDLRDRDPSLRRAAVRALSRIGAPAGRKGLLRALADEDEQVVAWAAYGLGQSCAGHREPTVQALAAAAMRFSEAGAAASGPQGADASRRPRAWFAIARAVAECAAPLSEATLLGWALQGSERQAHAAVIALGDLASTQRRLREETFVALLKLAAGDATRPPQTEALYPFGRVPHLPPSVIERTREVAEARLAAAGPSRLFAINALSRTGESAASLLADVVRRADDFSAAERAQAARGLKQLGSAGQRALGELLADLMPQPGAVQATTLIGEEFGVLWTVVSSLGSEGRAGARLRALANLPAPAELPRAIRLRVSLLRCTAAQLLAERQYTSPLLTGCDVTAPAADGAKAPQPLPYLAARAVVASLGTPGAKLKGARLTAWRGFTEAKDARVRAAAISLIGDHPEIEGAAAVLAKALAAEEPAVVAAAAGVIAKAPARANQGKKPPKKPKQSTGPKRVAATHPDVVAAVLQRLDGDGPTRDLEALAAVIDAAGALLLDPARPPLRKLCRSPRPTIRKHAQGALTTILGGDEAVRCEPPDDGLPLPAELSSLLTEPTTLKLESDAGALALRLDPSMAPAAVTRVVELARGGFYDGMVVHRVEPGFVVQFGSPSADGFGGSDRPALPCETSPQPFGALGVGMALAGRDTGNSQLFVTLGTHPHLDGHYAWLGVASGPWGALAPGDIIHKVKVAP